MIKADLHNHLGKGGKFSNFDNVVNIAYNNFQGPGMFAVLNSAPDDYRYEKLIGSLDKEKDKYERVWTENTKNALFVPKKNIFIIKGQEIESDEGHIIILGLPINKNIRYPGLKSILMQAQEEGFAIIAPHPFYSESIGYSLKQNTGNYLEYFDSIETFNGSAEFWFPGILPKNANKKAREFYSQIPIDYNIGQCSGTDGHDERVIGKCWTEISLGDRYNSKILNTNLKQGLRNAKSPKTRNSPNYLDSINHAKNMALSKIKNRLNL